MCAITWAYIQEI